MAFYRTGTISLTNGSNAVIGAGTDFLLGASIGECVQAPDGKLYEILKINCAQGTTVVLGVTLPSIELGQPYLGATASGQPYSIVPTQSYIRDLASQAATLVNGYGDTKTNAILLTAADKATPVDTDKLAMRDSVSGLARMLTWANAKAALKTYFDSVATTLTNKTLTNPVINEINGTPIGATTQASGSFSTLNASGVITATAGIRSIHGQTAAVPNGALTDIFELPFDGVWKVYVLVGISPQSFGADIEVMKLGTSVKVLRASSAALYMSALTISGITIQGKQNSGGTNPIKYSATCLLL